MSGYLRRSISNFKEYIVLVVLIFISLTLLSQNENDHIKKIRMFALGAFGSVNSFFISVGDIFTNSDEINALQQRNSELMLRVNLLREYGLENSELRNLLNFKDTTRYELQPAKVISRLVSKVNGYFLISAGLENEINSGMPVINDKGLIGIITDCSQNYSTVRLLTNSLFKVAVKDQRSNVNGILNWNGKDLIIKNVPTTDDIEVGDRIVTSEFSTIIPPSIPIGIVANKETTISGVLSNIVVRPYVQLISVKNIFVLKTLVSKQLDSLELNLYRNKN